VDQWRIINGPERIHEADVDGELWAVELEHLETNARRTVEVELGSSAVLSGHSEAEVRRRVEQNLGVADPPGRWRIEAA
jgi:hypothetical protein